MAAHVILRETEPEQSGTLDLTSLQQDYAQYNELVWRSDALPQRLVHELTTEALALKSDAHRVRVPGYKKSGSVSAFQLRERAPMTTSFYNDPKYIELFSQIAGVPLVACPDDDPHAFGLYYYTEAGDRIGYHYDSSHYEGARYTVLVGLVNQSSSELICFPYKKINGPNTELRIATEPGTLVFFNGGNIWHSVSPVAENEERIVLTLEYVTSTKMNPFRRAISNFKDAATYFGFKQVFGSRAAKQ